MWLNCGCCSVRNRDNTPRRIYSMSKQSYSITNRSNRSEKKIVIIPPERYTTRNSLRVFQIVCFIAFGAVMIFYTMKITYCSIYYDRAVIPSKLVDKKFWVRTRQSIHSEFSANLSFSWVNTSKVPFRRPPLRTLPYLGPIYLYWPS